LGFGFGWVQPIDDRLAAFQHEVQQKLVDWQHGHPPAVRNVPGSAQRQPVHRQFLQQPQS
jgi:hypothetical protein